MNMILFLFLPLFFCFDATLLYFNDAHEFAPVCDKLGERGGVARLVTVVDSIKSQNPNTLIIFGGDLAGGSLFGGFYHGFPIVDAFNKLPVDVATFGQHDFDFGVNVTQQLVDSSKFDWLTSNLRHQDGSPFYNLPITLIKQVNDLQIGFIGLTDAMNTTPRNDLVQVELVEATAYALEKMENVDVIIAVTQTDPETNERLLGAFPQINAILTEERSETETRIFYVGDRPVISPCGNLGSVARLDISKRQHEISLSVQAIPVDSTVKDHPEFYELQQHYQQKLQARLGEVVAHTTHALDAGINSDFRCRWGETTIGNLITDAFRFYFDADIAVLNGGGIRANIAAGDITAKDVLAVLPFGNNVCLVEMTGLQIAMMLEHGVSDVENLGGQFLQISGATYTYDWSASSGDRLSEVRIDSNELEPFNVYSVALPDYVLMGGNDFNIPSSAKIVVAPENAPLDFKVVYDFARGKRLDYQIESRINILNMDK